MNCETARTVILYITGLHLLTLCSLLPSIDLSRYIYSNSLQLVV